MQVEGVVMAGLARVVVGKVEKAIHSLAIVNTVFMVKWGSQKSIKNN